VVILTVVKREVYINGERGTVRGERRGVCTV